MSAVEVAALNIEEGAKRALDQSTVRRPWLCFVCGTFLLVCGVAGGGPLLNLLSAQMPRKHTLPNAAARRKASAEDMSPQARAEEPLTAAEVSEVIHPKKSQAYSWAAAATTAASTSPPPPQAVSSSAAASPDRAEMERQKSFLQPLATATASASTTGQSPAGPICGDGKCEPPETIASCFGDCPGITTEEICGEEPHADPQGNAVVDGRGHHVKTAGECCAACQAHALKHPKNRPCNSWVFCYMPHCWSADNGNTHLFGECWLKWQTDPAHPLYGQRGQYTDKFRRQNRDKHLNGNYPNEKDKNSVEAMRPFGIVPGSKRNLTVPTHVAWTGGVLGAKVTYPSVMWTTDSDGSMRSSTGEVLVDYRPWESREQNLKRGVKPEQMKF